MSVPNRSDTGLHFSSAALWETFYKGTLQEHIPNLSSPQAQELFSSKTAGTIFPIWAKWQILRQQENVCMDIKEIKPGKAARTKRY